MAGRRSYGSGRLFEVADAAGRVSWYGSWWSNGTRVKRKIGAKRTPGTADGLTRAQAERELRKRIERDTVVPAASRRTLGQAGESYVDHLEHVMERKRSAIQDYRGHLRRHLIPFFGERPIDKIGPAHVAQYLKRKDDLVFCHPETGYVYDPSKMRKRFNEAIQRAGVRKITFHELRHTFGTQMAAAGAPLRAIQEWMGHADAKATEIYRHYAPDPTHGAAFVERAFGPGDGIEPAEAPRTVPPSE